MRSAAGPTGQPARYDDGTSAAVTALTVPENGAGGAVVGGAGAVVGAAVVGGGAVVATVVVVARLVGTGREEGFDADVDVDVGTGRAVWFVALDP
jgi:hypothetical protein